MDTNTQHIILTTSGVLAALLFLEVIARNQNTIKARKSIYDKINEHLSVPGFRTLAGYLTNDNWLTDKGYVTPPGVTPSTILTLGEGPGKTIIKDVDNWLRNLTAGSLSIVVDKAIDKSPTSDMPADRQQIMKWLSQYAPGASNVDVLVKDLNLVGWVNKTPVLPPNNTIPLYLRISKGSKETTILNYHQFLLISTSQDIIDRIDPIIYPEDHNLAERQLTYLQAIEAADANITGFKTFSNWMVINGFTSSPQKHEQVPNLTPLQLGGTALTKDQLTTLFTNGTDQDFKNVINSAINSFNPASAKKTQALAALANVVDEYGKAGGKGGNMQDVYNMIKASGFVQGKYTPPNNLPKGTYTIRGFGRKDVADMGTYLQALTIADVQEITNMASVGTTQYQKWVSIQMMLYDDSIYDAMFNDVVVKTIENRMYTGLDQDGGYYYTPPKDNKFTTGFASIMGNGYQYDVSKYPTQQVGNVFKNPTGPILLWTGADPKTPPLGVLVKTRVDKTPNTPFYNQNALNVILNYKKQGKPVLLP
jgi:hypothetical protein